MRPITYRLYLTVNPKTLFIIYPKISCKVRCQKIQVRFLPFCFPLATNVSSCIFLLYLFFSLFCWELPRHPVVGHSIFIFKNSCKEATCSYPQPQGASKVQLCLQYFCQSSRHNRLPWLKLFHLYPQQRVVVMHFKSVTAT